MTKKRILFVDDEADILAGLRNVLRKQRHVWDMVFALGAEQALAELDKGPFDVIVSDMRMPGMDGASLLTKVKRDHPCIVRIVLSGHAEREAVIRAVTVAHQFLSKPCDGDVLRARIESMCGLQSLLHDPGILHVIGTFAQLPCAPKVFMQLTEMLAKEKVDVADIAQIVERDPAMAAKVLQLVNSEYFGLSQRISSIHQAVTYLGVELIEALAVSIHVSEGPELKSIPGFSIDRVQSNAFSMARLARRLASGAEAAEEAFAAAMLHDVGKIILALGMPDRFAETIRVAAETRRPAHDVERELLGLTHAEVGAYLLGVWGLPFRIVEAVAYHHTPSRAPGAASEILTTVHVAATMIDWANTLQMHPAECEDALDMSYLESAGCAVTLPRWREMAIAEVSRMPDAA